MKTREFYREAKKANYQNNKNLLKNVWVKLVI